MDKKTLDKAAKILDEYFAGSLPTELEVDIRAWLASGENRNEKDHALEQLWNKRVNFDNAPGEYARESLREISSLLGFPTETTAVHPVQKLPRRRNLLFRIAAVLIPVLCLAGVAVFWLNRDQEPVWITVVADSGVQEHFTLPDSSEVWLNPNGRLSYPEKFKGGREIRLDGEAFFNVTENENDPFTVSAGTLNVTVHGTRFMVVAPVDKNRATVTLHSGSVEVDAGQSQRFLKPGEQLQYYLEENEIRVEEVELEDWTKPSLDFYSASLDEIFYSLEKNFGITIRADEALPKTPQYSIRFSAKQDANDVLRILSSLTRTFTFTVNETDLVEITMKK